jgi:hypothetical protein
MGLMVEASYKRDTISPSALKPGDFFIQYEDYEHKQIYLFIEYKNFKYVYFSLAGQKLFHTNITLAICKWG